MSHTEKPRPAVMQFSTLAHSTRDSSPLRLMVPETLPDALLLDVHRRLPQQKANALPILMIYFVAKAAQ